MTSPLQMNIGAARWLATLNLDSQERARQEQEQHTGLDAATPSPTNERLNRAFAALFAQLRADAQKAPHKRQYDALPFKQLNMALRAQQHHRVKQADHGKYLLKQNVGDSNFSFQDIIDELNGTMNSANDQLSQFERIVEYLTKILQIVSEAMTEVAAHIKSSSDGKSIEVDKISDVMHILYDIKETLTGDTGELIPNVYGSEALLKRELGPLIPDILQLVPDGTGNCHVAINDSGLIDKMANSCWDISDNVDGTGTCNPAAYQAWWAGFQGMESQVENMVQTAAEKYSHQNSNFDNLIKIISSTVQSMVDTSKQFLQI